MNLTEKILEFTRKLDENQNVLFESNKIKTTDEELIALFVLSKHKIKPGVKELKSLEKLGFISKNKITEDGKNYLLMPDIKKRIKSIAS